MSESPSPQTALIRSVRIGLGCLSGAGMALAAWLLIAPDVSPPQVLPFEDKFHHVLAFGCLAGPALLVLPRRYWGFWLGHMLALGAAIEVVQGLAGIGRSGSVVDFLADAVGIFAAALIAAWIRARVPWLAAADEHALLSKPR